MEKPQEQYSERVVAKVPLKPIANVFLDTIRETSGVVKVEAVQRIIEWFSGLDRKIQMAVLNRDIETQRDLIRSVLSDMAGDAAITTELGPLDEIKLDDLIKLQRRVNDQIARVAKQYQQDLGQKLAEDAKKK